MVRLKRLMASKEDAHASMTMIFVMIFLFIFVVVIYALLTVAMLMTHQHEIDDALADSVLACSIVDEEEYFGVKEDEARVLTTLPVKFKDVDYCHNVFNDCLQAEINAGYTGFYDDLKVDDLIFYEVDPGANSVKITRYDSANNKTVTTGVLGTARAATGEVIQRTSVYAKVSFNVHAFFVFDISQRVTRDLYSTIKVDDANPYITFH